MFEKCTAFQCASATTRMVWAGDQLIWELRQASQSAGETSGPSDAYGTVSYMHAGGIDRPLVITKNGESVLPHQNWRGQFSRGTYASGASSDCAPGQNYNCAKIAWPGWRTTAWHVDAKDPDIRTWWGGLVDGMRDVSGQMYMRNRYYDPATGQFTQTDPIGIAGGLNTYGFAAGDPITYNDPYGLCPPQDNDTSFRCLFEIVTRAFRGNPLISIGDVQVPGRMLWDPRNFRDMSGAIGDFVTNYSNMREANTRGADKYFHAKANCEAAQRGAVGQAVAVVISESREVADRAKGDPAEASAADQVANRRGRALGAENPGASCREMVSEFRPGGLDTKY